MWLVVCGAKDPPARLVCAEVVFGRSSAGKCICPPPTAYHPALAGCCSFRARPRCGAGKDPLDPRAWAARRRWPSGGSCLRHPPQGGRAQRIYPALSFLDGEIHHHPRECVGRVTPPIEHVHGRQKKPRTQRPEIRATRRCGSEKLPRQRARHLRSVHSGAGLHRRIPHLSPTREGFGRTPAECLPQTPPSSSKLCGYRNRFSSDSGTQSAPGS
jgi:hypothetical protein